MVVLPGSTTGAAVGVDDGLGVNADDEDAGDAVFCVEVAAAGDAVEVDISTFVDDGVDVEAEVEVDVTTDVDIGASVEVGADTASLVVIFTVEDALAVEEDKMTDGAVDGRIVAESGAFPTCQTRVIPTFVMVPELEKPGGTKPPQKI